MRKNALPFEGSTWGFEKGGRISKLALKENGRYADYGPGCVIEPETEETRMAYAILIRRMSKELKRISVTEQPVENEKYVFRCFLVRLGFIGDEYKISRRILLRNSALRIGATEK